MSIRMQTTPLQAGLLAPGVWGAFSFLGLELFEFFFRLEDGFFGVFCLLIVEREVNSGVHGVLAWLVGEYWFAIDRASIDGFCCCGRDCETNQER